MRQAPMLIQPPARRDVTQSLPLILTVANPTSSTTSVTRCSNQLPLRLERHQLQYQRHVCFIKLQMRRLRFYRYPGTDRCQHQHFADNGYQMFQRTSLHMERHQLQCRRYLLLHDNECGRL